MAIQGLVPSVQKYKRNIYETKRIKASNQRAKFQIHKIILTVDGGIKIQDEAISVSEMKVIRSTQTKVLDRFTLMTV